MEARIDAIQASLAASGSEPATWWVTTATDPPDLGARLEARGFVAGEMEYGMVIDTDAIEAPAGAAEAVGPELIDAWLDVMARAYAWSDPRGAQAWAELYRAPIDEDARPWWHVLVRRDGQPAACASLFTAERPRVRDERGDGPRGTRRRSRDGRDAGRLGIARDLGYRQASLAASEMGRGVYLRIGFREDVRLGRWISP